MNLALKTIEVCERGSEWNYSLMASEEFLFPSIVLAKLANSGPTGYKILLPLPYTPLPPLSFHMSDLEYCNVLVVMEKGKDKGNGQLMENTTHYNLQAITLQHIH